MTSNQDVDFEFKLPALNMSCSALDMLYLKSDRKEALPSLVKHLQGLSQQARLAGRHQVSIFKPETSIFKPLNLLPYRY